MQPSATPTPAEPPQGACILFAEHDEAFRKPLAHILRREGYSCVEAATEAAAAEALESKNFDLLIIDLQMTGGTGDGLIRKASAIEVPVIILTGHPNLSTALESIRLHVAGYLVKPSAWPDLRQLIQETLETASSRRLLHRQQQRLTVWTEDLRQLYRTLQSKPSDASFVGESLKHLVDELSITVGEMVSAPPTPPAPVPHSADSGELMTALKETIAVLEETKHAFKSKQLGNLRHKLAQLVAPPPPKPLPGPRQIPS